jgi:hypothetical protein
LIVSVKVAWCVWVKLNVLQKRWLVCRLAALLILRSVGILSSVFSTVVDGLHGRHSLAGNGLRAGDRSPVLRLRQGYGACTLLCFVLYLS